MKSVQFDLYYSKAAKGVLCQQLAETMADVALIREPCIYRGKIRGIANPGVKIFDVATEGNAGPAFM
jgi:hypothetical protein